MAFNIRKNKTNKKYKGKRAPERRSQGTNDSESSASVKLEHMFNLKGNEASTVYGTYDQVVKELGYAI